ncbi:MAG: EamA family transporter [Chloroflexota bacterium]
MGKLSVAVVSIALWTLLLVASRVLLLIYGFDPWSFTFIQLISGGLLLVLLSMGGDPQKQVDWRSLRRFSTWTYGILRVTTAAAFTAALVHVSVVQAGFLGVINVPLALVGAWLFFGRMPLLRQLPGHLVILGGIAVLAMHLEGGYANPAVLLMLVSEVAVVGSSLIAEKHPDNNDADPRMRLRFTGVVLLLTAGLFLVLRLGQGFAFAGTSLETQHSFALLDNRPLWICGIVVGVLLRGPAMHMSLQAIRLVGTETYVLCAATLPFWGWLFEITASRLGILRSAPVPTEHLFLGCLIVGASIYLILVRRDSVQAVVAPQDA